MSTRAASASPARAWRGHYAAWAGCFERRLAAASSHGAAWSVNDLWRGRGEEYRLAGHIKWVFGQPIMAMVLKAGEPFTLQGILGNMRCPPSSSTAATMSWASCKRRACTRKQRRLEWTLPSSSLRRRRRGSEHCQHDNPTIGEEYMLDWLVRRFGIDEREILSPAQ
jgi:hypothetical protein